MDGAADDELRVLVVGLREISAKLTGTEAAEAFAALVKATNVVNPSNELLDEIGMTAAGIAQRLTTAQALAAYATALQAIESTSKEEVLTRTLSLAVFGAASRMAPR